MGTGRNSGDTTFSSQCVKCNIGNYEICVLLDDTNRFLRVESVKVRKNFYDPTKLPTETGRSAEEIVDEFFRDVDDE